jgi:hypothetical protein
VILPPLLLLALLLMVAVPTVVVVWLEGDSRRGHIAVEEPSTCSIAKVAENDEAAANDDAAAEKCGPQEAP